VAANSLESLGKRNCDASDATTCHDEDMHGESDSSWRRWLPLLLCSILVAAILALAYRRLRNWHGTEWILGSAVVCAYVGWALLESRISVRDARRPSVEADRYSAEIYALAQGATSLSALAFDSALDAAAVLRLLIGASCFALGIALRLAAVRELGATYSHRVHMIDGHQVVSSGPYRWLRHPAYAGMLLAHAGFVTCFPNALSAGLLVFAMFPAIIARIHIEERQLLTTPAYREFCAQRARLIPGLW
jgi:protein-S-isoprenylcysteine O-methyltransferase Ste14